MIRSGELLDSGQVLLETPRLIEDAIASNIGLSSVILCDPLRRPAKLLLSQLPSGADILRVPAPTFATLSSTESAPGALALAAAPHWKLDDLFSTSSAGRLRPVRLLVVAGVQDPGNLGAMLRAAEAFGFSGAIHTRGTVSRWNAKAFRASAGSALRLPEARNFSPAQVVQLLHERGVRLFGATVRDGILPESIASSAPLAIAMGAEAAGLPSEIERACQPLSIPMAGRVDSLNVAAAAAIIMYEVARRSAPPDRQ